MLYSSPSAWSPLSRGSHTLQPILHAATHLPCAHAGPPTSPLSSPCNVACQEERPCPLLPSAPTPCACILSLHMRVILPCTTRVHVSRFPRTAFSTTCRLLYAPRACGTSSIEKHVHSSSHARNACPRLCHPSPLAPRACVIHSDHFPLFLPFLPCVVFAHLSLPDLTNCTRPFPCCSICHRDLARCCHVKN